MMQLIKATKNADMAHSDLPALFYFSPDDKVVDPQQTEHFIRRWRGPKQVIRIAGRDSEDHLSHLITALTRILPLYFRIILFGMSDKSY